MNQQTLHTGKVILAASGCGHPDLITVRAARYLQQADVVLADRLVSEDILKAYISLSAEIVYVGKQNNNTASYAQQDINELLVKFALQGKLVVRLKGGDTAFFSNILDELETLVANNISYEIVPGITAASGASAYAGIPLTARGYATSVRMLTYYNKTDFSQTYWAELAATDDTLVFYMSSQNVDAIVENLVSNTISSDKLLAVLQQATTAFQQVHITNLYQYAATLKGLALTSPTLLIIGRVVALHQKFNWLKNAQHTKDYFRAVELNTKTLNT